MLGSIPKTHPTLFHTIPIGIGGFGEFSVLGSEVTQRISRGDYCAIYVEICEISLRTLSLIILFFIKGFRLLGIFVCRK